MAVTHQSSTTSSGTASTLTIAHDSGSGSNRFLMVYGAVNNGGGAPAETVDSATYNGVSMTAFGAAVGTPGGGWPTRWFYLTAPATGSNNAVISYTNSGRVVGGFAQTYNGVDQSTPYSGYNTATGTSTTPSVTISSAVGDLVVAVVGAEAAVSSTEGAGQTERVDFQPTARHLSATEEAGAASVTMDCTLSGSAGWAALGASLKAAAAAATGPKFRARILGLGDDIRKAQRSIILA